MSEYDSEDQQIEDEVEPNEVEPDPLVAVAVATKTKPAKTKTQPKKDKPPLPKIPKKTAAVDPETPFGDMSKPALDRAVSCLAMAGDYTRMRLLAIANNERTVTEITTLIGQSQPAVSHHLALLKHSGLMSVRRDGKCNYYSLSKAGRVTLKSINSIVTALNAVFGELDDE